MDRPEDLLAHARELRARFEPLREELRQYLEETNNGYFIRHPFCNSSVSDLDCCAWIHEEIDTRTAQADERFEAQDWEGWINSFELCEQVQWFAKDAHLLPDDGYWIALRGIHTCVKNTFPDRKLFDQLFRADRPGRESMMTSAEREVLARLPEVLTVYRGYANNDDEGFADGVSWTLCHRAAVWHANRNRSAESPRVITGKIRKADVWAYLADRDLFLPPEAVFAKCDRDAWCEKAQQAWSGFIETPFDVRRLFAP